MAGVLKTLFLLYIINEIQASFTKKRYDLSFYKNNICIKGMTNFSVTKNVEYFTKNDWSNSKQHKTCQHLCYIVQDKCFDDYFFFWRRECDI